jgi:hypothetical protein
MSIYGKRRGLTQYVDEHEPHIREQAPAYVALRDPSLDARDWSLVRSARPVEGLLPHGEKWVSRLPPGIRPVALATQFPRLINLIALQWNDRSRCPAYFEELHVDRRGGRRGFPVDVRRELSVLYDYWYSRDPVEV